MTQKDYVKEKLAQLKIAINWIVGAMFALAVYNIQTSRSNEINVMRAALPLGIAFAILGIKYNKLLAKLKDLP